MSALFAYFNGFLKLSPESQGLISDRLEVEAYKKGSLLWKAGQRCGGLYFITTGVVRVFFYTEDGEEHTAHFSGAGKFIADLESLNTHTPSSFSCVAATDCEVNFLSATALQTFDREVFEWHELVRRITEKTLFDKIRFRTALFQKEAKERYQTFLELFPLVATHVQAGHIASYLGISQYTLSHLKKGLANEKYLRNSKN